MQPSFHKDGPDEATFATLNRTKLNPADLSVLINESTSRVGRAVINKLNSEMQNRSAALNDGSGFMSRDHPMSRSATMIKNAHSILGTSPADGALANHSMDHIYEPSVSHLDSDRPRLRAESAVDSSAMNFKKNKGASLIKPLQMQPDTSTVLAANNPNANINSARLNRSDANDVASHWQKQDTLRNAQNTKEYIDNLVQKVEDMENQQKNFKMYDKQILDAQDSQIKKWLQTQKKVDEERRVEIETRLRSIFKEKEIESSGYSPAEGFLLSIDFV